MGDQYEEYTTPDGQNITYIQYIHPNDGQAEQINFIIPNNHILKQEQNDPEILEETFEEYIDMSEDNNIMAVEVLESVVNIGKKGFQVKEESLTRELVQISDSNKVTLFLYQHFLFWIFILSFEYSQKEGSA